MAAMTAILLLCAANGGLAHKPTSVLARVDHLVYATRDVDHTVDDLERILGIRAVSGGRHPGRGTRNALIALGGSCYLEIVGPDSQAPPTTAGPWWLRDLTTPRIVAWSAKGKDLERLHADALRKGVPLGEVLSGNRQRPDGVVLTWRFTDPRTPVADGIVPFFIDWGETPHPALTSAPGGSLIAFRAEHPDVRRVGRMLQRLGIDLHVTYGKRAALIATIEGPRGRLELR
jgi:hypothetical protein